MSRDPASGKVRRARKLLKFGVSRGSGFYQDVFSKNGEDGGDIGKVINILPSLGTC